MYIEIPYPYLFDMHAILWNSSILLFSEQDYLKEIPFFLNYIIYLDTYLMNYSSLHALVL